MQPFFKLEMHPYFKKVKFFVRRYDTKVLQILYIMWIQVTN